MTTGVPKILSHPSKPSNPSSRDIRENLPQEILGESHALLIGNLKSIPRAVIRVIHFLRPLLARELPEQHDFGLAASSLVDAFQVS